MENQIQVFVKGVEGKTSTVFLPSVKTPISSLFEKVSEFSGIPPGDLRLNYGTKELRANSSETLEYYGIGNLSTVFVVLRLLGGIKPGEALRLKKQQLEPLDGYIKVTTTRPCMITLDDDSDTRRAIMPCTHVISPMAMTQYCKSLLDEQRYTFPCPYVGNHGERCTKQWEFFLVKHVAALSQDELKSFEEKLGENYARKAMGVQQCPGCHSFCQKGSAHDKVVRCVLCTKIKKEAFDFCWSCLHESTRASSCTNPGCNGQDPRMYYLQNCPKKEIVGVKDCPSLRACVSCGVMIEHLKACKHMTCIACKTEFCFICLKKKQNGKYDCGSYNSPCTPALVQRSVPGSN